MIFLQIIQISIFTTRGRLVCIFLRERTILILTAIHLPDFLRNFIIDLTNHESLQKYFVVVHLKFKNKIRFFQDLDIRLKWPNDIYANGSTKIGGNIINSIVDASTAICNVGMGINLSNSNPTICLNDLVKEFNMLHGKKLPDLTYEYILATVFNEIENSYDRVQSEGVSCLYETYYKYWLHRYVV